VKKLLIIQKDEAYFLFETLQVLEKNHHAFKDFQVTILADSVAIKSNKERLTPFTKALTSEIGLILRDQFDMSVNLSMNDSSWDLHGEIKSDIKIGAFNKDGQLVVEDLWSTYLLTLKAKAPFLSFHLQDIYKNILGIKNVVKEIPSRVAIKQIAIGTCSTHFFSVHEQEKFINLISHRFNGIPVKDLSEIDLIDDVSHTLYIGASNLESLKLCEAGAKGIFLFSGFQGFNLVPYSGQHLIISSNGLQLKADHVLKIVESELLNKNTIEAEYPSYKLDHETFNGAYLKSMNQTDNNYPFYQAHLVLWNFLLSISDVQLDISKCSTDQLILLKNNYEILTKFIRLYDYAMASVDTIHQESKLQLLDVSKIEGHLKNLKEIDKISDQLASSQSLLRPFLDFYRIRRSQNFGVDLFNQSQSSFLTYAEEHHALKALQELFFVTLRRNEVNL
jgi:hypothetical protein